MANSLFGLTLSLFPCLLLGSAASGQELEKTCQWLVLRGDEGWGGRVLAMWVGGGGPRPVGTTGAGGESGRAGGAFSPRQEYHTEPIRRDRSQMGANAAVSNHITMQLRLRQ